MQELEKFRGAVRDHLRALGRTQQELAGAVGLHPHVLSHKLHGHGRAPLTTPETLAIVRTLAVWGALTARSEVKALLELMAVPAGALPREAWETPPFSDLEGDERAPAAPFPGRRQGSQGLSPSPLPAPATALIGRSAERVAVRTALAQSRLVTLTGVGGTGKTRLALEAAREAAAGFPDGVAFANLAPIRDPDLFPSALLQALGMKEHPQLPAEERLVQGLRDTRLLLVVDNCEHLIERTDLLARLLSEAPAVHVLATSRVPLRLYGEHEVRVPPLGLPGQALEAGEEEEASEAVQLFVQRARAARADFNPDGETLRTVGAICVALDGLPLAIELAAARTKLFSPEALLPLLHARLALLTGGPRDLPQRQRTLRSALDWSYALLTPDDQVLFARLGIFAGSFDAVAAAVCAEGGEDGDPLMMLGRLEGLADQSLLEVAAGPTPRFRLLETLREYALARLAERGEEEPVRERHARYFLEVAEAALGPELSPTAGYLARLEMEQDNLRLAMDWASEQREAELAHRLICAHRELWRIRGQCVEGQQRAEEALAIEGDVPPVLRSEALFVAGSMARLRGDLPHATLLQEQSLALARETGDSLQMANACRQLAAIAATANDPERARSLLEDSLALTRAAGNRRGVASSIHLLAWLALYQGQLEQAQMWWEESLPLFQELDDRASIALISCSLGGIALERQELERAVDLLLEGLALGEQIGYAIIPICFLEMMADVAMIEEDARSAARFLAAAGAAREASGEVMEAPVLAGVQKATESGRVLIGETEWDRAFQEGRTLPLEATVAMARTYAVDRRPSGNGTGTAPDRPARHAFHRSRRARV